MAISFQLLIDAISFSCFLCFPFGTNHKSFSRIIISLCRRGALKRMSEERDFTLHTFHDHFCEWLEQWTWAGNDVEVPTNDCFEWSALNDLMEELPTCHETNLSIDIPLETWLNPCIWTFYKKLFFDKKSRKKIPSNYRSCLLYNWEEIETKNEKVSRSKRFFSSTFLLSLIRSKI